MKPVSAWRYVYGDSIEYYSIYKLQHIESGKVYVGFTGDCRQRIKSHFSDPASKVNAFKYKGNRTSIRDWTIEILERINIDTKKYKFESKNKALNRERYHIFQQLKKLGKRKILNFLPN